MNGKPSVTLGYPEVYNIMQPYSNGRVIVYGEPDMGWYDYVLVDSAGLVEHRTDDCYGIPEIALRDALIRASEAAP